MTDTDRPAMAPTCDRCGERVLTGYLSDPDTLALVCLDCAFPEGFDWRTLMLRKVIAAAEEGLGRVPRDFEEVVRWMEERAPNDWLQVQLIGRG